MNEFRDNHRCYVCGDKNPAGLNIAFTVHRETRSIEARFVPAEEHQGFEGMVHGGILSAVLDEAMAKLASALGPRAVTAEITVAFKTPSAPGDELAVSGVVVRESGRLVLAQAKITRGPVVIAEAKGKLLRAVPANKL